jgi:hypothetical protein
MRRAVYLLIFGRFECRQLCDSSIFPQRMIEFGQRRLQRDITLTAQYEKERTADVYRSARLPRPYIHREQSPGYAYFSYNFQHRLLAGKGEQTLIKLVGLSQFHCRIDATLGPMNFISYVPRTDY